MASRLDNSSITALAFQQWGCYHQTQWTAWVVIRKTYKDFMILAISLGQFNGCCLKHIAVWKSVGQISITKKCGQLNESWSDTFWKYTLTACCQIDSNLGWTTQGFLHTKYSEVVYLPLQKLVCLWKSCPRPHRQQEKIIALLGLALDDLSWPVTWKAHWGFKSSTPHTSTHWVYQH